ncbi:MAG: EAL domain-containing protein [Parasphingorhabdus sp.]
MLAFFIAGSLCASSHALLAQSTDDNTQSSFDAEIGATKSSMMSDPAAALRSAKKAAQIAKDLPAKEAVLAKVTSQWLEGEALTRLNKAPLAEPIISEALETVETTNPNSKLHADLLKSKAAIVSKIGKVEDALSILHKAYRKYEELGEKRSQAIILHNIGSIYYEAGDYARVLRYYDQAKSVYGDDPALNLSAFNNRGNALRDMGRFVEAEQQYQAALSIATEMQSPLLQTRILNNIAFAQFSQKHFLRADATAVQGLRLVSGAATDWEPFLWGTRAQVALAQNQLDKAENFIRKTFGKVELNNSTMEFRDYHKVAFDLYKKQGNTAKALTHLEAYKRLSDNSRDLKASTNASLLAAQFDDANRELRISKLEAEETQREMALSKSETKLRYITLLLVFAVVVISGMIYSISIIRRRRQEISEANEKLSYTAKHDLLTGLANRGHYQTLLSDALIAAKANGSRCAIMLIDLDRFKAVNDTHGHETGDQLLCLVAEHLVEVGGNKATAVRLGGDEFALVIPDCGREECLSNKANQLIKKLSETHSINGTSVNIGATIGLAVGLEDGSTVAQLTRSADLALYHGKDLGRGCVIRYQKFLQLEADERHLLEADLRNALVDGGLSIAYQSIVDASNQNVVAYEALLRWEHPTRGMISPDIFIPIAEEARLINQIGSWVIRSACAEAKTWPKHVRLSVNVSALQVEGGGLANIIVGALAASGLNPERLELEVTESVFLDKHANIDEALEGLRSLGVGLVLDDFGTGYSSLGYLRRAKFSSIKIDRSFVLSASEGSKDSLAIIRAIVSMADELGIKTTAEGIESDHELNLMRELGCAQLQGYFFSRPEASVENGQDNNLNSKSVVTVENKIIEHEQDRKSGTNG